MLDMGTARDRIIGILVGSLVVFVIFTAIWPGSMASHRDLLMFGPCLGSPMSNLEYLWAAGLLGRGHGTDCGERALVELRGQLPKRAS